ncbi:MAG: hypothetical protein ACRC2X_15505 [Giesbergeria sp.]
MTNPHASPAIPPTTQPQTSTPIIVAPPQALGDTLLRFGLCLTWGEQAPTNSRDNAVTVERLNSAGHWNHIATLTPAKPTLRDLAPDTYRVIKGLTQVPLGVDVSGTAISVSEHS